MKVNVLIMTHGRLGEVLLETAADVTGRREGLSAKEVDRQRGIEAIRREIRAFKKDMPEDSNLLILTDMPGGTPFNICVNFAVEENVELISGVNFPMLLSVIHAKDRAGSLAELARVAVKAGKDGIFNCSERLTK